MHGRYLTRVNVDIRARGQPLHPSLRSHADQRLRCALSRFSNRIRGVRLALEAGPTTTTRCEVSVKLDSGEQLRVEDESADVRLLLDLTAERVGRLVSRRLAASALP